jgi:N-formylglutamate deformylase
MSKRSYRLREPQEYTSYAVFASPHSGRKYPAVMLENSVLDALRLRSSEDAYVDCLFEDVTQYGAPFLDALYPRAWVDLNRGADELDPALIEDLSVGSMNPRILSGLGVIPRVVSQGREIYRGKLPRSEVTQRITHVWKAYHDALEALLLRTRESFGQSLLIDCHSMPRDALKGGVFAARTRPEVVIGDRFGASARPKFSAAVEEAFRAEGFVVARNTPFAGAYIVQHYGKPFQNQSAVQVEVDRSLYMNEVTLERSDAFDDVKAALGRAACRICEFASDSQELAAE